jgi:hypothetical protein
LALALTLMLTSGLSAVQAEPFLPGGWVKAAGNPIFIPGPSGSWDDQWVCPPSVILDGSTYKMWYTGVNAASERQVGLSGVLGLPNRPKHPDTDSRNVLNWAGSLLLMVLTGTISVITM